MRKIAILLMLMTLTFVGAATVSAFDKCDQDCQKCHTLDKEQAQETLKKLIPDVQVLEVQQGPIRGLWEIGMSSGGKKGILYVDYSKKKIIAGNIFEIDTKKNFTQESFQRINKVDFSSIPLENSIVMGNKDAKYKIVVFDDPDWPYCAKLHQEMKKILEERKDIAFYIKLFPLPMHKDAKEKSIAIMCGDNPLVLLDDAFAKKELPKPKPGCNAKVIDENIELGQKLGISGTPGLILPNGTLIPGYRDAATILKLIDSK